MTRSTAASAEQPERARRNPWLSRPNFPPDDAIRDRLRAVLALRPLGLFSDIDGTLSAIAPTPDAAALLPGVADLLTQALSTFDLVAAVSGRTAVDARALVGLPGILYIGNHGLEYLSEDDKRYMCDPRPSRGYALSIMCWPTYNRR